MTTYDDNLAEAAKMTELAATMNSTAEARAALSAAAVTLKEHTS